MFVYYLVWYLWHPNAVVVACSVKENMWHWVIQWFCVGQQILCHQRCACHLVLVGLSLEAGSMLSWQLYTPPCLPSLRPFVSPLSPLLAFCLLFCLLALACSSCLAWFPLLLHRWKLLSFIVLKRMRKRVATKESVRRLRGQSPKICFRTSFGPRSHLVRTSLKLQPIKTQLGEVLERLCNGLLLGLLLLLLFLN